MIRWLNPAALSGLVLLAVPVLIHLLRTHRAERVLFPSLRFVVPSRTAAVRLRLPADWVLLLVRLGIVGAAVTAAAGPVVVTAARLRGWNARIVRAVIVDVSAAMSVADGSGVRPIDAAREAAAAEDRSALLVQRIDSAVLGDGLVRAMGWLSTAPPARREVVVISTFTAGAFEERDISNLPAEVGLRFVRVGAQLDSRHFTGLPMFSAGNESAAVHQIELTGPKTGVSLIRAPANQSGLRVLDTDPASPDLQRLWRAVAAAGAPAAAAAEPLVVQFSPVANAPRMTALDASAPRWMVRTLARLQADESLRQATAAASASPLPASPIATPVAVDKDGQPLVRLAALDSSLLMQVAAPVDSFVAAAAVRSLLLARAGDWSRPDQEILRTPPETLAAWSRPPPGVDGEAWRHSDSSDGRWWWVAALILLGLEQRLRRSTAAPPVEVRDAA